MLASLLDRSRLDPDDLGRRLVAWYETGALAVDARVFDVGVQTARAIRAIAAGTPALQAASADSRANGNGSLMRALPLALWHRGPDADLVAAARLQSRVTHAHRRSQLCCALHVLWARRTLEAADDPWSGAAAALRATIAPPPTRRSERQTRPSSSSTSGQTTRRRATAAATSSIASAPPAGPWPRGDHERVVKVAIALGGDTDTTACVAGGIAGVRDGVAAIPPRWLAALRGRELCDPLIAQLLAHAGA